MSQCFVLNCVLGRVNRPLRNSNYETRKLITKTEHYNSNDDDEHIHAYLCGI